MNANEVKEGDIIHSDDDSIIKVHHIDKDGGVHYMAYADCALGSIQVAPYLHTYGTIDECCPASEGDKQWMEDWIKEHTPTMENNEKTVDDIAEEYATSVALTCKDNGDPLPQAFIHLLVTAYVAGYNHVGNTM